MHSIDKMFFSVEIGMMSKGGSSMALKVWNKLDFSLFTGLNFWLNIFDRKEVRDSS